MATIRTAIELQDNFTGVLYQVINSVNLGLSAMEDLHQTMNSSVDTASIEAARDSINQATIAVQQLDAAMQGIESPTTEMPAASQNSDPVVLPVHWQADSLDVFTNTGVERFEQEVQSANDMLSTLNQTQAQIIATAAQTDLFPASAVTNMNNTQNRLLAIQQRIQAIENNPMNMGTDVANAELEQLRGQLNQAVQEQNELNQAMQNMDISAANAAYLRLSQTISGTERYIRDNVDEQGRFNREIEEGTQEANGLMDVIKGAVAAYATIQTLGKAVELSDTMTQITARLDLIVDDGGSVEALQNKIYASAQNARASYLTTADAVSKMGMQASQAFNSNDELIAFTELLNKQFVNAGTSAQGIDSVMLQLTQSMAAGKLQGEELNAVLDNAAPIVQNIQQYLEEVQGIDASNIKELASDGVITAEIIKNSMFYAADEINAKFESMPMTWGQIWDSFQNNALMAFQPVLQRINEIANSEAFQGFVEQATDALATVAETVLNIFDLVAMAGGFVADNWSWLSSIIYGVAGALAVYYGWQLAVNTISLISKGIHFVMAAAQMIHAAATGTLTAATAAEIAAQNGLNASLYACPIVWIIILIIALIAIIYAVCAAIAKFTGIADSGFGVICGGVNVVIQFWKNFGLTVANIALGIKNAIEALNSNIKTAFHNAICSVQSWWYDLLSTCLSVIESICAALNKLPFVEFDYSGISNAADDYAAKSAEAAGNKKEYQSIGDAFNEGYNTFDTFQDGWISDAFNSGAAWGDGVSEKFSSMFADSEGALRDALSAGLDIGSANATNSSIASSLENISSDTSNISDAMDITEEDLKYLRDIAEQEVVNRFTTAEITIEQTNHNNVSGKMDLDGVVSGLTDAVNEAVDIITEGVHA